MNLEDLLNVKYVYAEGGGFMLKIFKIKGKLYIGENSKYIINKFISSRYQLYICWDKNNNVVKRIESPIFSFNDGCSFFSRTMTLQTYGIAIIYYQEENNDIISSELLVFRSKGDNINVVGYMINPTFHFNIEPKYKDVETDTYIFLVRKKDLLSRIP